VGWEKSNPEGPKGPQGLSALQGWILEILCCDPKGSRAFLRILSTEGRGVGLCWEKSKHKGPNGPFIKAPIAPIAPIAPTAIEGHPLDARREPSALQGWIRGVLYMHFDPKGSRSFLRMFSMEGRGVRLLGSFKT